MATGVFVGCGLGARVILLRSAVGEFNGGSVDALLVGVVDGCGGHHSDTASGSGDTFLT